MSVEGLDTFICGVCNVYFYDLTEFVQHKNENECDGQGAGNGQLAELGGQAQENREDIEDEIHVAEEFEAGDVVNEETLDERYEEEVEGSMLAQGSPRSRDEEFGAEDEALQKRFEDDDNVSHMMTLDSSEMHQLQIVHHEGVETDMIDEGIVEDQLFQVCE